MARVAFQVVHQLAPRGLRIMRRAAVACLIALLLGGSDTVLAENASADASAASARVVVKLDPTRSQITLDGAPVALAEGQTVTVMVDGHFLNIAPLPPQRAAPPPAHFPQTVTPPAPAAAPLPWTPLLLPETPTDYYRPHRNARRRSMAYYGPPYRSVAAAKRAYHQGLLDREAYADNIWVLKLWFKQELRAAKLAYKTHAIDRWQYKHRVHRLELQYRGP